jgi:hypothetical protein
MKSNGVDVLAHIWMKSCSQQLGQHVAGPPTCPHATTTAAATAAAAAAAPAAAARKTKATLHKRNPTTTSESALTHLQDHEQQQISQ